MCRLCPEAKKQMLFIGEALRRFHSEEPIQSSERFLSPEARNRIKLALRQN
jgi:hypothetical protein